MAQQVGHARLRAVVPMRACIVAAQQADASASRPTEAF